MRVGRQASRRAHVEAALAAAMAAWLAAGCIAPAAAEDDDDPLGQSWSSKISDSIKHGMNNATKAVGFGRPAAPPVSEAPSGCPTIAILAGTQAQRVMAPGTEGNEGLRYQYSLLNVGRECSISGGRMSVKVGADGRVLLGPAGAAGHFDVPIRVVVVSQVDGKPVESKLYRVPASIGSGQDAAPFQFVSDSLVVPIASGRSGIDYAIKVGIDDGGKPGGAVAKKAHKHGKKELESASQ